MSEITSADQPKQIVAIYGPPGSGKSTLVAVAKKIGWHAVDLEGIGSTVEERKAAVVSYVRDKKSGILFGAADIPPELFPQETKFVLLAPGEDVLTARVQGRNDTRAHKWIEHAKKVRGEHLQMAEAGAFDLVITDDIAPEKILGMIASAI